MASFSFDDINRIIEVATPTTEITIQELIDAIRDWEDELENMDTPKIADASGKEDLGGGLQVGITLKLSNWKLKFEDRLGPDWVDCGVTGGNLVAVNGNNQPMNPIEPAAYVTVTVVKAVSAALIADDAEWTQGEKDNIFATTQVIKGKTDNLPSDPADQSLVNAHVTAEVDEVKSIIGTPTSPTIADDLNEIATRTDKIPNDPAIQSLIEARIAAAFSEIKGAPWTDETLKLIKKKIEDLELQPYPSRASVRL